jgi:hypothetical protein
MQYGLIEVVKAIQTDRMREAAAARRGSDRRRKAGRRSHTVDTV